MQLIVCTPDRHGRAESWVGVAQATTGFIELRKGGRRHQRPHGALRILGELIGYEYAYSFSRNDRFDRDNVHGGFASRRRCEDHHQARFRALRISQSRRRKRQELCRIELSAGLAGDVFRPLIHGAGSRRHDGQTDDAYRYLNKAAEFKELHIGTTLGQTHYDFSIQLLKLMHKLQQLELQKFEHKNWWYNFPVLGNMAQLTAEKYMQQFLIINQFSQNPERDRVVYKLFSTESTVSWDEIWYLIRDFSTGFFLDRFQKELKTDERKYIRKYFRYFIARLQIEKGNYDEANRMLNEVLMDPDIDGEYEKLLIARTLQAQAEIAEKKKDNSSYNDRMYRMYQYFPQLIPYSGLTMSMHLTTSGNVPKDFMERLKSCNINWTNNKFHYIISGVDKNNNPIKEEKVIDIPNGKYKLNELIMKINSLLKKDKNFFKASLEDGKVTIDITKSTYSIDFSRQNTLANVFGFGCKVLTHGKHVSENNYNSKTVDDVFILCNLIDDSYVNNKKSIQFIGLDLMIMK